MILAKCKCLNCTKTGYVDTYGRIRNNNAADMMKFHKQASGIHKCGNNSSGIVQILAFVEVDEEQKEFYPDAEEFDVCQILHI